jgi:chromosome segregation ATPase
MEDLIKSAVKCYKKKTKKRVGGRRKTYQYYQYQVPLKKSDDLTCGEEVFIVPQKKFEHLIEVEVAAHLQDFKSQHQSIAAYEKELAELEWKHGQLSKSYKELVAKYNKKRKTHEKDQKTLSSAMESIEVLKEQNKQFLKEIENKNDELRQIQNKYKEIKKTPDGKKEDKTEKEKDFWSRFRGRG